MITNPNNRLKTVKTDPKPVLTTCCKALIVTSTAFGTFCSQCRKPYEKK
jgi:hypothetical protein